jgi:hypothetical protein
MKLLVKFLELPTGDRGALIEAVVCLGLARLLLLVPFRRLAPWLGRPQPGADQSGVVLDAGDRAAALRVQRALLRAARHLPWHSSCLVCALGGRMMLGRRHLPSVLQLGARSSSAMELAAHAWLRCGEIDVIGAETAGLYTPIVAFRA